ncbi:Hsp70 family protein [Mycobacterium sp. ITM-2016-00318]|uniref:Hsp70 family protein n=1 Tax=Mycobacterium sp. ITM-2016-00318 TaxID=2099693 RepID=UPI000CFA391E|nr:Hsp70 family protein [Mycobacterium sp. ITM-2016-00318]WNG93215.1 Hsp70 family protein [Mycobacterium sp. ITM-2016-00318]
MSDPLGLSVGTTNLVAARVGNQPVTRRSMLTLAKSGGTISGFVERVGDRVPLVTPDGTSYRAEQLLMQALDAMVEVGGGPSPDVAIAVPAHWSPTTIWAFRSALASSRQLSRSGDQVRVVSDAVAALTALQANPGIAAGGVVALLDFGGSGTSITLADAAASFAPIGETVRYPDFSGDLIDQALLAHVLDSLADKADPAGTTAVESLTKLRAECRRAKERLSADTATQLVLDLPGHRADIRLTREELQELIQRPLDGVVAALDELTERNGTSPAGLAAVAIVGGGANIPLVTQRLSEHTQLPVVTTPQPALNAAVGAALFAAFGADADAPTGANAATALGAEAPTGAAAAATDLTAAGPVYDGPGLDAPGSATFRALAWSQEEGGEELVPYTGENPYLVTNSDVRPVIEYSPATGKVDYVEPRRPWHRMAVLGIGMAAVIAIVTVGGVAYALTSATESTRATQEPKADPPKPPEPKQPQLEPPAPPKQENPEPPPPEPPPPPPPPETVTITSEAPPPPQTPTTTVPTTTRTTTTTSPTTTTTSPTTTTTTPTTTTTTSTTPPMTTSWINVPFVPVPVPIQVPNQGPPPPPAYQPPVYPQGPWG